MNIIILIFIFILFNCCIFQITSFINCIQYDSQHGATFDLENMVRSANELSYIVEDGNIPCSHHTEKNYTYIFNICGVVEKGIPVACNSLKGLDIAGAIQIDNNDTPNDPTDDTCRVVGDYTQSTFDIKLYDQNDPTKGLELSYLGGEKCSHGNMNRRFVMNILCDETLASRPSHIYELSHCDYTATIPSAFGCPLECPVANRAICGGQGQCAYDTDARKARCFCYHGYKGNDCNDKTGSGEDLNYSPALLGIIITLFIVVAALVIGIVLMIRQMQAFKDDMSHYQVLRGDEMELSDTTVVSVPSV